MNPKVQGTSYVTNIIGEVKFPALKSCRKSTENFRLIGNVMLLAQLI